MLLLLPVAFAAACSSGGTPTPAADVDAAPESATAPCPNDLPDDGDCASATPSYDAVAPIIAMHCTICHTPGGVETSRLFGSYDQAYALRREMLTEIYSCRMPQPPAVPLTNAERGTILKWFVCGAPGPAADAAAP